jgi:hypothetical protein
MAVNPDAPIVAGNGTEPTASPNHVGEAMRVLENPEAARLNLQMQVYAHHEGVTVEQALKDQPDLLQMVRQRQYDAAENFFRSWSESIAENAAADRQASKVALATKEQIELQGRNAELTHRIPNSTHPVVERREDGLAPARQLGVRLQS